MRMRSTLRHRSRAQSIVELALITPLFILLLVAVFEGARLAYAYNTVNHAAQEAGRLAILSDTISTDAVKLKAVDAADPLTVNAGSVTVDVNGGGTDFGDRVLGDRLKVTVGYTFVPVAGMLFGGNSGLQLMGETELMVE